MVALGFHPGFVGQRQIHLHDNAVHKIVVAFALLAGGELAPADNRDLVDSLIAFGLADLLTERFGILWWEGERPCGED